jgi:hypothetical protein
MPKSFSKYWYQESPFVKNAFLFHLRDDDLVEDPTARIPQGVIVEGALGYAAAEQAVPGFKARTMHFTPNRQCEWQGRILGCMAHAAAPAAQPAKKELRLYNNIVARLPDEAAVVLANSTGIPVLTTPEGDMVVNLEVASFGKQGAASPRRAQLL